MVYSYLLMIFINMSYGLLEVLLIFLNIKNVVFIFLIVKSNVIEFEFFI